MGRFQRTVIGALVVALAAAGCSYTPADIVPQIPANAESSAIYAADGTLITTLHGTEDRVEVALGQIPNVVQQAVIAIEDERFYEHNGVDVRAIFRAVKENAGTGQVTQGGSTITQQLVKNTLLNSGKTLDRKIQEASLAWQLERHYTKQRILEIYLNTVYFGNGAYGVEAAAQRYFGRPVEQLDVTQAAVIAGLIHAPNDDDPFLHPDLAITRRNEVLDKMLELGDIDRPTHDQAVASPLGLAPVAANDRYPAAHFVEEVKKFVENDPRFGATPQERQKLLFEGGLRIHTTIDLGLQAKAEDAIHSVLGDETGPQAALVAVDPQSGAVRAMVGGPDYFADTPTAKCNLAIGCKVVPGRGTGSAFKPFVLAAALTEGIPLSTVLPAPSCLDLNPPTGPWHVCNADPGEGAPGGTDLIEGTVHSFNTLYAQLILKVGTQQAVDMAKRLGIVTSPLKAFPSAVLGSNDVTPLDMASAYGTFANRGVHVAPIMVTRIDKADGTVVYEAEHTQTKAIDQGVADTVTSVLQQVIQRGTGTAARLDRPAAGKTGTGEDYKNAWFCGYTPNLATSVWVGFPETEVVMSPPTTSITVYGGTWPARIWQQFMSSALDGTPALDFPAPPPPPAPPAALVSAPDPPADDSPTNVPTVVGMSAGDATAAVQDAGLVPDVVTGPPGALSGVVIRQSPTPGATLHRGDVVVLEVVG